MEKKLFLRFYFVSFIRKRRQIRRAQLESRLNAHFERITVADISIAHQIYSRMPWQASHVVSHFFTFRQRVLIMYSTNQANSSQSKLKQSRSQHDSKQKINNVTNNGPSFNWTELNEYHSKAYTFSWIAMTVNFHSFISFFYILLTISSCVWFANLLFWTMKLNAKLEMTFQFMIAHFHSVSFLYLLSLWYEQKVTDKNVCFWKIHTNATRTKTKSTATVNIEAAFEKSNSIKVNGNLFNSST